MQNENSQAIIKRFFKAIHTLIELGFMRGIATFTNKYKINRRNFLTLEQEPYRDMFELEWFHFICRDYGISPYWLLSGEGEMFTEGSIQKIINTAREEFSMGVIKVQK